MKQLGWCLLLAGVLVASAASADEVTLQNGERIYKAKCKSCHGAAGEGLSAEQALKKKLDPEKLPLAPMAEKSDAEMTKLIMEGKDKMTAFGEKLTEEQVRDVLEFCRTLVPLKAE